MEKKIKDDEDVRRKGVGLLLILALLFTVLLGLALAGCTKLEVTPPSFELRLSESKPLAKLNYW